MPPIFADGVEIETVFVDGVEQDEVFADGVEVFSGEIEFKTIGIFTAEANTGITQMNIDIVNTKRLDTRVIRSSTIGTLGRGAMLGKRDFGSGESYSVARHNRRNSRLYIRFYTTGPTVEMQLEDRNYTGESPILTFNKTTGFTVAEVEGLLETLGNTVVLQRNPANFFQFRLLCRDALDTLDPSDWMEVR